MNEIKRVDASEDQNLNRPADYTLETARSSLPPLLDLSDDFEREIEQAMDEEANRLILRLDQT